MKPRHEEEQPAGQLVPQPGERVRAEDSEVVVLLGAHPASHAQQTAGFFRDKRLLRACHIRCDPEILDLGMNGVEGVQWK